MLPTSRPISCQGTKGYQVGYSNLFTTKYDISQEYRAQNRKWLTAVLPTHPAVLSVVAVAQYLFDRAENRTIKSALATKLRNNPIALRTSWCPKGQLVYAWIRSDDVRRP